MIINIKINFHLSMTFSSRFPPHHLPSSQKNSLKSALFSQRDMITLQDFVEFHNLEYEIVSGVYFKERNYKI